MKHHEELTLLETAAMCTPLLNYYSKLAMGVRTRSRNTIPLPRVQKLHFLFCKETKDLYSDRILSDNMGDSYGDYVFLERKKTTKKFRRFPSSASPSHYFFAKSPSRANFRVGHLNGILQNKKSHLPRRRRGRISNELRA